MPSPESAQRYPFISLFDRRPEASIQIYDLPSPLVSRAQDTVKIHFVAKKLHAQNAIERHEEEKKQGNVVNLLARSPGRKFRNFRMVHF